MWDLSSPTRDRTCTPCIGGEVFNHWANREVQKAFTLDAKSNKLKYKVGIPWQSSG